MCIEFVPGGSLKELIIERNNNNNPFTLHEIKTLMISVMNAIEHLHIHNVAHYDIKPANILLVDPNDLMSVKICDFGFSKK